MCKDQDCEEKSDLSAFRGELSEEWIQEFNHLSTEDLAYLSRLDQMKKRQRWDDVLKRFQAKRRIVFLKRIVSGVAAAVLVAGVLLTIHNPGEQKTIKLFTAQDIRQGRQKAVLELSDGRSMPLGNNPLDIQEKDGIKISSDTSGNLTYQDHDALMTGKNYNSLYVPRAGEYTILLSDGTKVYLNSDTKFRYPTAFTGSSREVWLNGEAFFEVAKDPAKPFIVNTRDMRAEVLGTSFNFSAYEEDREIQLTLLTGSVKVHCEFSQRDIFLKPDTQVSLDRETGTLQEYNVDARLYTLWKEGVFYFRDATLEEIAAIMSRCYDVRVKFNSEEVKPLKFYGQIDRYTTVDNVIDIINQTKKVYCQKVEDNLILISAYQE